MIEAITDTSLVWIVLGALGGIGYGFATASQEKLVTGKGNIQWDSLLRLALEGALGGVIAVTVGQGFGVEGFEAAAPVAGVYIDKLYRAKSAKSND